MNKKSLVITVSITAVCVFILTTAFYLSPTGSLIFSHVSDTVSGKNYARFVQIGNLIDSKFMGPYTDHVLMDNALHMYVASLNDPYSAYFNKNEYEEFVGNLDGDYKGIGVTVSNTDGRILVSEVQKGSPAEKSGIQNGDIITAVNGTEYTGAALSEAVSAIRKTALGGRVKISIERNGNPIDIDVVIEEIKIELVSGRMLSPVTGYIRLQSFGTGVGNLFKAKANELKKQGMKGLIIDLRSNPGGSLESAVEVGDFLLPEGKIITIKQKSGEEAVYKSDKSEIGIPMCVLINESSASASEVISGALRDHKKATLIGKKTYGKGVVQTLFELGDKTALRLTTAKYFTPSGECIDGIGIAPDIEVDLPEGIVFGQRDTEIENDTQLNAAIEEMNKLLTQDEA